MIDTDPPWKKKFMLRIALQCIERVQQKISSGRYDIILSTDGSQPERFEFNSDWNNQTIALKYQYSLLVQSGSRLSARLNRIGNAVSVCEGSILVDESSLQGIVMYPKNSSSPIAVLTLGIKVCPSESRRPSGSIPSEPVITNNQHENMSVTTDILNHFFSDISATKNLIETYKRWAIRCGPLRFAHDCTINVFTWAVPVTTCLLIVTWTWICIDSRQAVSFLLPLTIVGSLYLFLLVRTGAFRIRVPGSSEDFISEDIETNLQFNNRLMTKWCDLYDHLTAKSSGSLHRFKITSQYVFITIISWMFVYLLPTRFVMAAIIVLPLIWTCPLLSGRRSCMNSLIRPQSDSITQIIEVYENQRWWLGSWSEKGLAIGTSQIFPWSDISGKVSKTKTDANLPPGYEWIDLWHLDDKGWIYAINFENEWFHEDQRSSDFVRKRRWTRTAQRTPPIHNQ